jgi:hypothetical protein
MRKCEDNIKMDLREIGWVNVDWIHFVQERGVLSANVNTITYTRGAKFLNKLTGSLMQQAITQLVIRKKIRGISPRENYTDRAASACR